MGSHLQQGGQAGQQLGQAGQREEPGRRPARYLCHLEKRLVFSSAPPSGVLAGG
jgi:hypothetical protein